MNHPPKEIASIEQDCGGKYGDKLVLTHSELIWEWRQGSSTGKQSYPLSALAPTLGAASGKPENWYINRKRLIAAVVILGVIALVPLEGAKPYLFGLAALASAYFGRELTNSWYTDHWTVVTTSNGEVISSISHKYTDEQNLRRFENKYTEVVTGTKAT